jgi:protein-disulfide isomerase
MTMIRKVTFVALMGVLVLAGKALRAHLGSVALDHEQFEQLLGDGHWIGNRDAAVKVLVFSNYACGFCKTADSIFTELQQRYPSEVVVIVRHYVDPEASYPEQFTHGVECAAEQDYFVPYHRAAFRNLRAINYWNAARLVADSADIPDMAQFERCVTDKAHADRIRRDWQVAQHLGVSGTPTLFVNGTRIVGAPPLSLLESFLPTRW